MAKITAEDLVKIVREGTDFGLLSHFGELSDCNDDVQESYRNAAKRINDFLIYGHLPKKD